MGYRAALYDTLHPDCIAIRTAVFVEEQGFQEEFDEMDAHSTHLVLYDGDTPVATGRLLFQEGGWWIGRVAVMQACRGAHLGSRVLSELEALAKERGADHVSLAAQCRVQKFYESAGYTALPDYHDEEGVPHVKMVKKL
ncbi:MAG: GNAT family N-acetyltransferase [Oscillospiraceae bacterium]|nr:GNAT family N-acetyltransferase [Oscillospiraceae bacterium]